MVWEIRKSNHLKIELNETPQIQVTVIENDEFRTVEMDREIKRKMR